MHAFPDVLPWARWFVRNPDEDALTRTARRMGGR